ncbi:hypothetical protein P0082_11700 [Candidatus Haliotispira prima]|uniref:Methyltransferase small domain-containing protein n=1 Tax=Candidatus Haliotispira prima TaxID=3034016 RepID=A0ABY8MHU2_9SPIO|nr:hypothetical protein P0082_11700 [Candidatus Haliotispira prima]
MNEKQQPTTFPELLVPYCHNTLTYRYWGKNYHLASSPALFSATRIDRGSQMLLTSLLPHDGQNGPGNPLQDMLQQALESSGPESGPRFEIHDWGCGIGTLGLMVQGHIGQLRQKHNKQLQKQLETENEAPPPQELQCELRVFDRDALALAFTRANWEQNISPQPGFRPGLHVAPGIWGEEEAEREPDSVRLVLSNIPAKLGEPVLRKVLPALATATEKGPSPYVAIVIVAPLRHLVEEAATASQIQILYKDGSGDHCVYHYRRAESGPGSLPDALKLYKRGESCFVLERKGNSFNLRKGPRPGTGAAKGSLLYKGQKSGGEQRETTNPPQTNLPRAKWLLRWPFRCAYGLTDFDRPGYRLDLLVRLLAQRNWGGRVLLWEPGHGHLACFLALKPGCHVRHIDLAGRDRLALLLARYNLENLANFHDKTIPTSLSHSVPCPEAIPHDPAASWDMIVLPLDDKFSKEQAHSVQSWLALLPQGTHLCLLGRSRVVQQLESFGSQIAELRGHGFLAKLLCKTGDLLISPPANSSAGQSLL